MIKRWLIVAMLFCSTLASSNSEKPTTENWKERYSQLLYADEQLKNQLETRNEHIKYQDKKIDKLEKQVETQEIKEKERMLFTIPFTNDIGISKDEVKGGLFIYLAIQVHPLFIAGLLL